MGLKLKEFIAREVRGQKKRNGRLSSKFMVKLYDEYDLDSSVFNDLPDPEEDDASVDEELLEHLGQCHDENPAVSYTTLTLPTTNLA